MNPQEEKWITEFKNNLALYPNLKFEFDRVITAGGFDFIAFIHKTREEAREEGYKRGYKLGSEINIPVKGRLTETWNLAIQACVEDIEKIELNNFTPLHQEAGKYVIDLIRTSLLSLKK